MARRTPMEQLCGSLGQNLVPEGVRQLVAHYGGQQFAARPDVLDGRLPDGPQADRI
ncbi:hypothetical protein D1872_316270 [compost metagenome]